MGLSSLQAMVVDCMLGELCVVGDGRHRISLSLISEYRYDDGTVSGHYRVYILLDDGWFCFDDSCAGPISEHVVMTEFNGFTGGTEECY